MAYTQDRMDYYVGKLKPLGYYLARSQDTPDTQTRYMISSQDWRKAVIFTTTQSSCFRLDFLVVDSDDSKHMSEEEFVRHLDDLPGVGGVTKG
jgi:hypothetical protein